MQTQQRAGCGLSSCEPALSDTTILGFVGLLGLSICKNPEYRISKLMPPPEVRIFHPRLVLGRRGPSLLLKTPAAKGRQFEER